VWGPPPCARSRVADVRVSVPEGSSTPLPPSTSRRVVAAAGGPCCSR